MLSLRSCSPLGARRAVGLSAETARAHPRSLTRIYRKIRIRAGAATVRVRYPLDAVVIILCRYSLRPVSSMGHQPVVPTRSPISSSSNWAFASPSRITQALISSPSRRASTLNNYAITDPLVDGSSVPIKPKPSI